MVTFFLNVRFVRIFFQKLYGLYGFFQKIVRIVRIFSKKNVRIVRIFSPKMYGLYGFFLKMYGFLYGFFQKSFGHPESDRRASSRQLHFGSSFNIFYMLFVGL